MRSVGLSKIMATDCGPASGRASYGAALMRAARVEDLGLLGGGEVVVGQEVARHRAASSAAASRMPGQAATKASTSSGPTTSGGANRMRSGPVALMIQPAA